ncbi:MAG: nucleotide exchange factor GrpE [Clostridia bacterium]
MSKDDKQPEEKQNQEQTNQTEAQKDSKEQTQKDQAPKEEKENKEDKVKLEDLSIEQLRHFVSFQGELNNALTKENENLIKKVDELRAMLKKGDSYLDQLVAIKNDFESYKQRIRFDADISKEEGTLKTIEKIFPFIDTLEKARVDIGDGKAYELIYRQFCKALFEMGITELDVLDKPFDHNTANAVNSIEVKDEQKGKVVEVYQKGFIYKDHIIRYAQVVVGK